MPDESKQGEGESNRGFASMDPDKQRDIARKGGESVPAEERSFAKDRELASEAGRKGGEHSHGGNKPGSSSDHDQERRGGSGNFAEDRERASEAGRKGGSE